jgi:gas vesicle protein
MVQRVVHRGQDAAEDAGDTVSDMADDAGDTAADAAGDASDAANEAVSNAGDDMSDSMDQMRHHMDDVASDIHDGAHGDAGPGDDYDSGGQDTVRLEGENREGNPPGY